MESGYLPQPTQVLPGEVRAHLERVLYQRAQQGKIAKVPGRVVVNARGGCLEDEGREQRRARQMSDAALVDHTGFTRNRMWQSREVISALGEFVARAGRRG